MKRKIEMNNKKYTAECNAFTIIDYRNEFNRDILSDITFINKYLIDSILLSEKMKNGENISKNLEKHNKKLEEYNKKLEKFIDILTRITYIVLFNSNDIENYDKWINKIEKISLEDEWIGEVLELVNLCFINVEARKEIEKRLKNNDNEEKEEKFSEHAFIGLCLKMHISIAELKLITYVDVLKILISFLPETVEKNGTRMATQEEIASLVERM